MEIDDLQKLIKQVSPGHKTFEDNFDESVRYYKNQNDITRKTGGKSKIDHDGKKEDLLRNADNRISSNFHQLLVDQEASYLMGTPPTFDVGNDTDNQTVQDTLGDQYPSVMNKLTVDAANAGIGWIHYWIDDVTSMFRYGVVEPAQIIPIFSTDLDDKLIGILRAYTQLDDETGKVFKVYEYWTDKQAEFFRTEDTNGLALRPFNRISTYDITTGYKTGESNVLKHDFGRVPFIPFPKNRYKEPDLFKYKGLIDAYDDVYNGFLNDLDDIQQTILVLKNYGGTDLKQFMHALREDKAIKFNNAGNGDQTGVDTLQIEIPVEARDRMLQLTRDNIFLHGQGVDPSKFDSTNASGVAIKMLYSHLELKASRTETNFKDGLNTLVRAIMNWAGMSDADGRKITQTWTRTKVEDDLSKAQVVSQMANYSSKEAVAKANPIVNDWVQELKDQKEDAKNADPYAGDDFKKPDDKEKPDDKSEDDVDE